MCDIIDAEFNNLDLGDKRLNDRFKSVIEGLSKNPGKPITQCFQYGREITACYRFMSNPSVTTEQLFEPHREATISRIKENKVVFCVNDTSSFDYTTKESVEGLGVLEASSRKGFFLHPLIAVNVDRVALGTVDLNIWTREKTKDREKTSGYKRLSEPIENKESFRWINGYREACKVASECPETEIIYLADREADIIDLCAEATDNKESEPKADLIIRSSHDRLLDDPDKGKKLRKKLELAPKLGEIKYNLKRKGKEEREVTQTIKACKISFKVKRPKLTSVPTVTLNAVMAIEENPPQEGESPINWVLLTTIPVTTFEDAAKIIKYYTCRWEIEMFFNVLKSGMAAEKRGLNKIEKLKILMTLFVVIAFRVMLTCKLSRKNPEFSCSVLFTEVEWKAAWSWMNRGKVLPKKIPSLGEICKIIARMGGHMGGKKSPPPGYRIIWRGLSRLQSLVEGWESHAALPADT